VKKAQKTLTFGETIRDKRESLNLSIREVASNINIDPSLLGKIERNERSPTKLQIELLGDYLKVDKTFLIIASISDEIVYKIIEASNEIEILKVAEYKVKFLTSK